MYFRYHVSYSSPKTNMPVGITVAVWHLLQAGLFNEQEAALYHQHAKRLKTLLPVPPFYDDGNSIGAVTWFKQGEAAASVIEQMKFYFLMMDKYGEQIQLTESNDPGSIIYEDEFQVGVVSASSGNEGA